MATKTRAKRRYMSGISSRLNAHYNARQHKEETDFNVPYRRFTDLSLDAVMGEPAGTSGTVRVWRTVVLHEKYRNPAREFATSRSAEMWTLNGQTHVTRSDLHFRNKRVNLEALVGHLLVEVELDGLSPDAKAQVITTGRHTMAQRALGSRLEEAIDQVLAEDDQLLQWESTIRDAAFKLAASQRIAGLDAALRAFGLTFRKKETILVPGPGRGRTDPPELKVLAPISPLYDHPTQIFQFRKVLRERIKVRRGATASVLLEADARDGYFDDPKRLSLQFIPDLGDLVRIVGRDSLKDGRMRVRFKAAKDAPIANLKLNASCVTPTRILNAEIEVEVAEPTPKPKGTKRGRGMREKEVEVDVPPPVQVHYQDHPDFPWPDAWNEETVGEYDAGVARINGDYSELATLRKELPIAKRDDITNVYIAPIAMTIVGLAEAEREAPQDGSGHEIELPEHFRRAALRSAALSSIFAIRYMHKSGGLLADLDADGDDEAPSAN